MLDFSNQTQQNIMESQLNRVPNTIDKREGSMIQTSLGPESWTIEGIYMALTELQNNSFATTATGEFLDYKAAERGIYRNPATSAQRQGEFNVEVPINSRFQTIDGNNSVTFYVESIIDITTNPKTYKLICETAGQIGNSYVGNLLPITPVPGLTSAILTDIIQAGSDEEDDASLRARYLESLNSQNFSGNIASYRTAVSEEPTASIVQVYPAYPTGGYVLLSVLDANYNLATPALIELLQNKICPPEAGTDNPSANGYGLAPIGAIATVVTGTELLINIEMTLTLIPGTTEEQIRPAVEQVISNYLENVRRDWANMTVSTKVEYLVSIYISRITVGLLTIDSILNVTGVQINGVADDLNLTETGALQQVPFMGTVTINVV